MDKILSLNPDDKLQGHLLPCQANLVYYKKKLSPVPQAGATTWAALTPRYVTLSESPHSLDWPVLTATAKKRVIRKILTEMWKMTKRKGTRGKAPKQRSGVEYASSSNLLCYKFKTISSDRKKGSYNLISIPHWEQIDTEEPHFILLLI